MSKTEKITLIFLGALVAGLGIEWFVNGISNSHSNIRNGLVIIQILAGVFIIFYSVIKKRKE